MAGCRLENNGDALYVSGPANGTTVNVDLKDSVIAHCTTGVHIGGYGTVEVGDCRFSYLAFLTQKDASSGGTIKSFGNNTVTFGAMNSFDSIRSSQ